MASKHSNNDGQLPLPKIPAALEINQGARPAGMPSLAAIKAETARIGLPDTDAEYLYDAWMANGFKTRTGKIKSWTSALRNYVRNSWLPSLRRANQFTAKDREAEELKLIKRAKERQDRYDSHRT